MAGQGSWQAKVRTSSWHCGHEYGWAGVQGIAACSSKMQLLLMHRPRAIQAGLSVRTSDTTCIRGACDVQGSQGFLASSWRLFDEAIVALPCRMCHMRNDMCTHSLAYSMYPISYENRPELPA